MATTTSLPGRLFLLGGFAALLLGAAGIILYMDRHQGNRRFEGRVSDLLPEQSRAASWTLQILPVADTPEMKKVVGELLNYDDAVFGTYSRGGDHFSVYVAYWSPGKMSPRLVAGHTPDVCWVGAGWQIEEQATIRNLTAPDGGPLLPGEERTMAKAGQTEVVVFWHLLGGQPISYSTGGAPPWYAMVQDLWRRGLNQRQEQLFVRISSNLPVRQWAGTGIYERLAETLPLKVPGDSPATRAQGGP